MATLLRFLRWMFERLATVGLVAVLAVGGFAAWYFFRDNVDFDAARTAAMRTLGGRRSAMAAELDGVRAEMARLAVERAAEEKRAVDAEDVAKQLRALESTWDRLVGNPEQQRKNAEQKAKMEKMRDDSRARAEELKLEHLRTGWRKDGLEIELGKLDLQYRAVEANSSEFMHYVGRGWDRSKRWVIGGLALLLLGPSILKALFFFLLAPLLGKSKPIQLAAEAAPLPDVMPSHVSASVTVGPGERLLVKERFLQASDEGLQRRSRMLLDWRIPLTCAASGLVEMVEMENAAAIGERHVTLSDQTDAHIELTSVELPAGGSIILRPGFIAGVVVPVGGRLGIRRRWQLFRWQAWITLQFRFFEFQGPCRIILAGSRGVRAERLENGEGANHARRINQDATIGFSPALEYRPVPAETFWGYYRGLNPLFDDLFSGRGMFLCQEISAPGTAAATRGFWKAIWSGATRAFGL